MIYAFNVQFAGKVEARSFDHALELMDEMIDFDPAVATEITAQDISVVKVERTTILRQESSGQYEIFTTQPLITS